MLPVPGPISSTVSVGYHEMTKTMTKRKTRTVPAGARALTRIAAWICHTIAHERFDTSKSTKHMTHLFHDGFDNERILQDVLAKRLGYKNCGQMVMSVSPQWVGDQHSEPTESEALRSATIRASIIEN